MYRFFFSVVFLYRVNSPALLRRLLGFAALAFLADEFHPSLRHNKPGISSMANTGPGTNGRRFFFTHVTTAHLNRKHSVFGEVAYDQEVNDSIVCGDTITKIQICDSIDALFAAQISNLEKWKAVMKSRLIRG